MARAGNDPLPQLVARVAQHRQADVYFFAGTINNCTHGFSACVQENAHQPNALLLLTTFGGSGDAAYQMARSLQDRYYQGNVAVLVSTYCKSAGTLLALGAKTIIMSDLAELGPLDVQITKPDTLGERTSGLTPSQSFTTLSYEAFQCFERFFLNVLARSGYAITTKTAALIAARMTAGLYRPVYAQIDPMRLGEFQRAVQIAMEYGKRLESWSNNLQERALVKLINGYPSHEFVIDRREAKTLFNNVECPTADEQQLADLLNADAMKGAGGEHAVIRYLGPSRERPQDGSGTGPAAPGARSRPRRIGARASRNGRGDRSRNPGEIAN